MERIIKRSVFILAVCILQSCATNSQTNSLPNNTTYETATTQQSYMFRSPPPAAVSAIRGR